MRTTTRDAEPWKLRCVQDPDRNATRYGIATSGEMGELQERGALRDGILE